LRRTDAQRTTYDAERATHDAARCAALCSLNAAAFEPSEPQRAPPTARLLPRMLLADAVNRTTAAAAAATLCADGSWHAALVGGAKGAGACGTARAWRDVIGLADEMRASRLEDAPLVRLCL
jgi:hypothetical protein